MKKKMWRIWRQMTVDKKKFGIFVTTLAIGLLLWGRLMLLEKVPRIATADPNTASATIDVEGVPSPDAIDGTLLPPLPVVRASLTDRLAQDLFAFRHNRYKPLPPKNIRRTGVEPGLVNDDEEVRRRELEDMVKYLSLQSVVQGDVPIVVINGRLLRVGDSIDGFEIVSFNNRSAKVTRDGLTFKLTMLPD